MYYVYILSNRKRNVLYTGVTNDLVRRITEHYENRLTNNTFAGRYCCYYLLFVEDFEHISQAIAREKEIKGWTNKKKIELIRRENPTFCFLNNTLFDKWPPF
jgi:putative endonuclease